MLAALRRWLGLHPGAAKQALLLAVSAWLAFTLAASLDVQNAYWAAMPVWVVAQPMRGMLLERALWRLLGTLLGAACGLGVLNLSGSGLQLAALSLSVGGFAALTHLLRGSIAYGALMAGITTAIVAIPGLIAPQDDWALALARVECTLIGVLTTSLILGLFTPHGARDRLYAKARELAADALELSASYLLGSADGEREAAILRALNEIDGDARPLSAGSLSAGRRLRHIDALLMASLNLMAAAQAMAMSLAPQPAAAQQQAARLRALAGQWRTGAPLADSLGVTPAALPPRRNARLEEALQSLWQAIGALGDGRHPPGKARAQFALRPPRDWRLAARTASTCALATLLGACAVLTYPGLASELAATGVCIFSMILGSLKLPQQQAPHLLLGVLSGVCVALCYRLLVQPQVGGLLALSLGLAPFLLGGALLRSSRRFGQAAVDGNMCFLLASQAGMPAASLSDALQGAAALLLGALLVGGGFLLFPRRPQQTLRLIARAICRDLRRLQQGRGGNRERWLARCGRRILLLLSSAQNAGSAPPQGLLALLNLGQSIIDLQALSQDPRHRAIASEALSALDDFASAPETTANTLLALTHGARERWLIASLENAAHALLASAALLSSSAPRRG